MWIYDCQSLSVLNENISILWMNIGGSISSNPIPHNMVDSKIEVYGDDTPMWAVSREWRGSKNNKLVRSNLEIFRNRIEYTLNIL